MKKSVLLPYSLMAVLLWQGCGGKITPFRVASYETNPSKVVSDFIETEGVENLRTYAFKKVAVIEFNVQYLVEMPESAYVKTTDELYEIFVAALEKNTEWEVSSKSDIAGSAVFRDLEAAEFATGVGRYKKGGAETMIVSSIYPASGLGVLSLSTRGRRSSPVSTGNNTLKEAGVLEDVGAAAALKVHSIVDYVHRGQGGYVMVVPSADGFPTSTRVEIDIGYTKRPSRGEKGYSAADGQTYTYAYKRHCLFELKQPLTSYESINAKRGTIELDELVYWTKQMFGIYAEMLAMAIAKDL